MFGQSSTSGTKPVCQFYLKGICKYGNKCWNLHTGTPAGNVFGGGTSSSVGFTGFGGNTSTPQNEQHFLEFVKQVSTEMNVWEKNGQWPLSCLAPLKEHPILAGFVDTSPEELRVEAYEALKANTSTTYQTSVNQKLGYQKQLREALKNQVPEAIEALKSVFYKNNPAASSTSGGASSTNLFGKPSAGPFSGNTTATQSSLFGGAQSSTTSVFGTAPNLGGNGIFGSKTQSPAFGAAPVFGASSSKGLEGGSAFKSTSFGGQSSNLFGASSSTGNPAAASNVFGGASQNQATPGALFGGTGSVFGSSPVGSQNKVAGGPFGVVSGSQTSSGTSLFGSSTGGSFGTSNSAFGATNMFGTSQQSQQQIPSSVAGGTMSNQEAPKLFGVTSQAAGNPQGPIFGSGVAGNAANIFGANQNQPTGSGGGLFSSSFGMNQQPSSSALFGNLGNNSNAAGGSSNAFGNSSFQTQTGGPSNLFGSGAPNEQQKLGSVTMTDVPSTAPTLLPQTPNASNSWFTAVSTAAATTNQSLPLFASQVTSNAGTPQSNASSIFGTQLSQQTGVQSSFANNLNPSSQNVFGAPQNSEVTVASTPTSSSYLANQIYTPLHLLSSEDQEEFMKEEFGRIPLVPPPRELCI